MKPPMRRLSSTVICGNKRRFSGTCAIPSSTIWCAGVLTRSASSITIEPVVGGCRRRMPPIKGSWPAPFGPMPPTASAGCTSSETSNKAWKVPYPAWTELSSSIRATRRLRSGACGRRDRLHGFGLGAEIDLDHAWIRGHLRGEPFGDLLAVIEHHRSIHHAHQDPHDVLDPDDGHTHFLADPAQHVRCLIHLVLVEAAQALVGEQQLGSRGASLGELQLFQAGRAEPVGSSVVFGRQAAHTERALSWLERVRTLRTR